MTLPTAPYVGLVPFREEDADFFYGRTADSEIIGANLVASRLTLLYGPSGVGKTSVLHAGVIHQLERQIAVAAAARGRPEFAVVSFSSWRDEPVTDLLGRVDEIVARTTGGPPHRSPTGSLAAGLRASTERLGGDLLIILDQFEEYFVYHEGEHGEGTWAEELPGVVTQPDLRVNVLISIREDALASLDQFKGRIPNLFSNYLRIEHLDNEAAREAIELPLEEFNRTCLTGPAPRIRIEPALVDAVLDQVQTGQVFSTREGLGQAGPTAGETGRVRVEAPFLQLVMSRLWDEEMAGGSSILRLETLERLGGSERIVRTHLDKALSTLPKDQQGVAARAFRYLVTPSGSKITHTAPDLAEYAGVTVAELDPILRELADPSVRVLRPVAPPPDQPGTPRYEIFHDVLAAPILDWRTRFEHTETARRLELERNRAQEEAKREGSRARRFRSLSVALILLILLTIVATSVALNERSESEQRRQEAEEAATNAERAAEEARQAEAEALAARGTAAVDPLVGLVFAVEAAKTSPEDEAAELGSLVKLEFLPQALFSPDGARIAVVDTQGDASVWDVETRERIASLETGGRVSGVSFSPDGTMLATADESGEAALWEASGGDLISSFTTYGDSSLLGISFSLDGRRLIAAGLEGETIWDVQRSRPLEAGGFIFGVATFSASFAWTSDFYVTVSAGGEVSLTLLERRGSSGSGLFGGSLSDTYGIVLSADRRLLATMNGNNRGGVWSLRISRRFGPSPDARLLATLLGHASPITAAAFDHQGTTVVTASIDGTARIWNATTGASLQALVGHDGPVLDAAFDTGGQLVVTAGSDGTIRVWDASNGAQIRVFRLAPTETVVSAAFSPDGSLILTQTLEGTARVWNVDSGQVEFTLRD